MSFTLADGAYPFIITEVTSLAPQSFSDESFELVKESDESNNLDDLEYHSTEIENSDINESLQDEKNARLFQLINKSKRLRKFILPRKVEKRKKKGVPFKRTILNYKHRLGNVITKRKKKHNKIYTYKKKVKLFEQIGELLQEQKNNNHLRKKSFSHLKNDSLEKLSGKFSNTIENVTSEIVVKDIIEDLFDNVFSTISDNIDIEQEINASSDNKIRGSEECITDKFLERLNSFEELNSNNDYSFQTETTNHNERMTKKMFIENKENVQTSDEPVRNHNQSNSTILPEKTTDITKIKGWRNKQFGKIDTNTNLNSSKIENSVNLNSTTKENDVNLNPPKQVDNLDLNRLLNSCDSEMVPSKQNIFELKDLNDLLPNVDANIKFELPILSPLKNIPSTSVQTKDVKKNAKDIRFFRDFKNIPRPDLAKKFKAKTLAEKRQFLKLLQEKEIMHEVELNESSIFKQLKRYENRDPRNAIKDIQRSLKSQTIPITRNCWMSIVKSENCCNLIKDGGKTIRIGGSTGGDIINLNNVVLNSKMKPKSNSKKEVVSFKPGPLSKKPALSLNTYGHSNTVITNLPQPYIEVCPTLGKPMDPLACQYLQNECNNGIISELWAEYSTAALFTEKPTKHFSFPIAYENDQKKILMIKKKVYQVPSLKELCKKIIKNNPNSLLLKTPEKQIKHEVMMVLSDMLDYLETPILDNSNIPYCPDCPEFKETENKNIEPIPNDVHTVLSGTKKRNGVCRKTELELKRLNVTVIEVELNRNYKENNLKKGKCDKIECTLGCVCYDTNVELPEHCGRENCMLECQCKNKNFDRFKERQIISLPEGSNLLCSKTVGQLQERAKRNLAKEERKFTQTVIKANDQTIVVGEGCRERRRRVLKVPQKLRDYVNSSTEIKNLSGSHSSSDENNMSDDETHVKTLKIWDKTAQNLKRKKEKIESEQDINSIAFVKVRNMTELKDVIPWCMVHNLYRCFCEGKELGSPPILPPKKVLPDENKTTNDEFIYYNKVNTKRNIRMENATVTSNINNNITIEHNMTIDISARTKGVSSYYLKRNKSTRFKSRITKMAKEIQNQHNELSNINTKQEKVKVKEKTKECKVINNKEMLPKIVTSRVEQSMLSVECETITKKLELKNLPYLLIPYPHIQQHLRMVVFKASTSKHIFRLMLWDNLYKLYRKNRIFIWHNPNNESGKLVATRLMSDRPSKSFINIKSIANTESKDLPKIVSSLLNDSIPGKKEDRSLTFVIFVFNGAYWELRGCVIQKPTDEPYGYIIENQLQSSKVKGSEISIAEAKGQNLSTNDPFITSVKSSSQATKIINEMSSQLKTNEPTQKLSLESKEIPLTEAKPDLKLKETSSPSIRVPIPIGSKDSRWFMLILENDFSILRIMKSQHVIKYSQLKEACQVALKFGKTVRFPLPRPKTQFSSAMPTYGLYAVPGLLERIFFGPYSLDEDHGIITYKYINGKLVNTKDIDQMYCPNEPKSKGIWLYTKGQHISSNLDDSNVTYVDLTVNEENAENLNEIKSKTNRIEKETDQSGSIKASELKTVPQVSFESQTVVNPAIPSSSTSTSNLINVQQKISVDSQAVKNLTKESDSTKQNKPNVENLTTICIDSDEEEETSIDVGNEMAPPETKRRRFIEERISVPVSLLSQQAALLEVQEVITRGKKFWLMPEPYSLGYIELKSLPDGRTCLKNPVNETLTYFSNMAETINWVDNTLRKHMCFVPLNFQVRMFLVDNFALFRNQKALSEEILRGSHMVCANGVYDLEELTPEILNNLNLNDQERKRVEEKQRQISANKALYLLGSTFVPPDQLRTIKKMTVIQMAPKVIEALQRTNVHLKSEKRALEAQRHALLMKKKHLEIHCNLHKTDWKTSKTNLENSNNYDIDNKSNEEDDNDVIIIEEVNHTNSSNVNTTSGNAKSTINKPKTSSVKITNGNVTQTNIENTKLKATETSRNTSTSDILKHGLQVDEIEISPVMNRPKKSVKKAPIKITQITPPVKKIRKTFVIPAASTPKNKSLLIKNAIPSHVVSNTNPVLVPNVTKKQTGETNNATTANTQTTPPVATPVNLANLPTVESSKKVVFNFPKDISLLKLNRPIHRFILPKISPPIDHNSDIIEID